MNIFTEIKNTGGESPLFKQRTMDIEKRTKNSFKIGQAIGKAKEVLNFTKDENNKKQLQELIKTLNTIEL